MAWVVDDTATVAVTVTKVPPKIPRADIISAEAVPSEVGPGEVFEIRAVIANVGEADGYIYADVKDVPLTEQSKYLRAGERGTFTWRLAAPPEPGVYTFVVRAGHVE